MATTPRTNFFILLGLNPDATWNEQLFETTLRNKRIEWSRQGAGVAKKALAAKQNIALIPEIEKVMKDPALREAEVIAARAELASGRQAHEEQFEKDLAFINAKDSVDQKEVDKFIDDFKDILTPHEIKKRITARVNAEGTTTSTAIPQLDASVAKNIADRLQLIRMSTLYDLLQCTNNTATPDLMRTAEKLYTDLTRQPPTPDNTIKSELAGFAKDVFRSDEMRAKYDETLRQVSLDLLLKELDANMNRTVDNELHPKQVQLFLDNAQKKGWKEKEALERLRRHAGQRRWVVVLPTSPDGERVVCPQCEELNDNRQSFCTKCHRPLRINCPNCGKDVSSTVTGCGNCGFPVGNIYRVELLLGQMEGYLKAGDLQGAEEAVEEAAASWKPSKPDTYAQKIADYRRQIQQRRTARQKSIDESISALHALIQQRKLFAARELIASKKADIRDWETQQRSIEATITQARDLLKRALASGISQDNKMELCRQALVLCADYKEARSLLETMPPPPPRNLQVNVRGKVVHLTWDASTIPGVAYKVVCKEGAQPNVATDGKTLNTVTGLSYDDSDPTVGIPLYYAIFSTLEGVLSHTAARPAQPIFLLADVVNVIVQVDHQKVTIGWEPPKHAHQLVIVRKEQATPGSLTDGMRLAEIGPAQRSFVDSQVENEHIYYYRIYCQFKDAEGKLQPSSGTIVMAIPETPPTIIAHIDIAEVSSGTTRAVEICWSPPQKGVGVIIKSHQALRYEGMVIPEAQLGALGKRLEGHGSAKVMDAWSHAGMAYYTPAVIFQQMAYLGASQYYACVPSVSNLRYQNLGSVLRLTWLWPDDCQEVYVAYNLKQWPQEHDPMTTICRVSRNEYDHMGHYDIRGMVSQDYYITVSAIITQGSDPIRAQGVRLRARLASQAVITYEIKNPSFFNKKRTLHILVDNNSRLPALLLIRKRERLPFRKTDGELFQRIQPIEVGEKGLVIELPLTTFPPHTFAKLFLEDDSLYEEFKIHHPKEEKLRIS